MAEPRVFSKSLSCVPKFTSTDVMKSVKMHSSTKGNKLDKGYKFVHEEFIHHYQERTLFTAGSAGCSTPLACTSGLQRWHRESILNRLVSWWCKNPKQLAGTVRGPHCTRHLQDHSQIHI
ncbi:uncharacterized protein LOC144989392 [Oryzias latipes]